MQFMHRLYWVMKTTIFSSGEENGKGKEDGHSSKVRQIVESALAPISGSEVFVKDSLSTAQYRHFRIEELKVKRAAQSTKLSQKIGAK